MSMPQGFEQSLFSFPLATLVCKEEENGRERQGGWRRIMRAKRGGGRREGESGVCVDKKRKKLGSLSLSLSLHSFGFSQVAPWRI